MKEERIHPNSGGYKIPKFFPIYTIICLVKRLTVTRGFFNWKSKTQLELSI
jgi:hypothetical protein